MQTQLYMITLAIENQTLLWFMIILTGILGVTLTAIHQSTKAYPTGVPKIINPKPKKKTHQKQKQKQIQRLLNQSYSISKNAEENLKDIHTEYQELIKSKEALNEDCGDDYLNGRMIKDSIKALSDLQSILNDPSTI